MTQQRDRVEMLQQDRQMIANLQGQVARDEFPGRLQEKVAAEVAKAFSSGKKITSEVGTVLEGCTQRPQKAHSV